jgi:hypothetical protein
MNMKKWVFFVLILIMVLVPGNLRGASNRQNPTNATNVELVKKVSINAPQGKGKTSKTSATGILGAEFDGTKYAIVIGISDYPGTDSDLDYTDDDARDVKTMLMVNYGFIKQNIYLLTDMDASYSNIYNAISVLESKATASDEVVFFFSGHGAKGTANDGDTEKTDEAIVSHDGNQNGDFLFIWDGDLRNWFSGYATSRIIFIFDSCLSGGMTDLASEGRIINMACSENGLSYESEQWGGGHGQFTYYFVEEGIVGGYADKYDSHPLVGDVTVEEAFDYASAKCVRQAPVISDRFINDLLP